MEIDDNINGMAENNNGRDQSSQAKITPVTDIDGKQDEKIQKKTDSEPAGDQSEPGQLLSQYFDRIYNTLLAGKIVRRILFTLFSLSTVLFIFSLFIYIIPGLQDTGGSRKIRPSVINELKDDPAFRKQLLLIGKDAQKLKRKFTAYTPGQSYLVINTIDNRFLLYSNKKLVRAGFCSTGSYTRLTNTEGSRHWIFKTPKGRFWIQQKITSPLWVRPDWSFVEEGLPIPPKNDESRYEYGVLGDYAMSLGDGYLIHGTLYKRFLGMPVTHGCVRLNDEDLESIYNTLDIGSKVFIF
jgi:hypothetical protein